MEEENNNQIEKHIENLLKLATPENIAGLSAEEREELKQVIEKITKMIETMPDKEQN